MRHSKTLLAGLAAGLIAACGSGTSVPGGASGEQARGGGSSLAQDAIAEIEARGGAARLVQPGEEITFVASDPDSDVFGTEVVLRATAWPEDGETSLLSIEPSDAPRFGAGQTAVGRAAEIRLTVFANNTTVKLKEAATIRMPYHSTAVVDAADEEILYVGKAGTLGERASKIGAREIDADDARVSGATKGMGIFVPMLDAGIAGNDGGGSGGSAKPGGVGDLVVTDVDGSGGGGSNCNTLLDTDGGSVLFDASFTILDAAAGEGLLAVAVRNATTTLIDYQIYTDELLDVPADAVDPGFPDAVTGFVFRTNCVNQGSVIAGPELSSFSVSDATNLPGVNDRDATFSDWAESNSTAGSCDGQACTRRTGNAWVRVEYDVTDPDDSTFGADVQLDAWIEFDWETIP